MARKVTRKSLKHDEFLEAAFDLEHWVEQHWRQAAMVVAGVVAVGLVAWGVAWWRGRSAAETERMLSAGLEKIRGGPSTPGVAVVGDVTSRYQAALPDFEQAARAGSGKGVGRVAAFYQGAALARTGRSSEAVGVLEPLAASGGSDLLADLTRAKLGWLYMETGQTDKAISAWKDLGSRTDGYYPGDYALLNAAGILKGAGRNEEAKATLQDLMARFPQGGATQEAAAMLAKVSGSVPGAAPAAGATEGAPAP